MVGESLHNVDGDSCFCDSDFHLSHSPGTGPGTGGGRGSPEKQRQVDQVCGALGAGVGCIFPVLVGSPSRWTQPLSAEEIQALLQK